MDDKQHSYETEDSISENQNTEGTSPSEPQKTTPLRTRIIAGIAALFVVILVLLYTYSIATGQIFAW